MDKLELAKESQRLSMFSCWSGIVKGKFIEESVGKPLPLCHYCRWPAVVSGTMEKDTLEYRRQLHLFAPVPDHEASLRAVILWSTLTWSHVRKGIPGNVVQVNNETIRGFGFCILICDPFWVNSCVWSEVWIWFSLFSKNDSVFPINIY